MSTENTDKQMVWTYFWTEAQKIGEESVSRGCFLGVSDPSHIGLGLLRMADAPEGLQRNMREAIFDFYHGISQDPKTSRIIVSESETHLYCLVTRLPGELAAMQMAFDKRKDGRKLEMCRFVEDEDHRESYLYINPEHAEPLERLFFKQLEVCRAEDDFPKVTAHIRAKYTTKGFRKSAVG